jgi:uncharacterized protein YcaQ
VDRSQRTTCVSSRRGTAKDLADYFRMPVAQAQPRLSELVESGQLQKAREEGRREIAYRDAQAEARETLRRLRCFRFDPLLWSRTRVDRLFGFEYPVEIFARPKKRK